MPIRLTTVAALFALAGCNSSPTAVQPQKEQTVNATRLEVPVPAANNVQQNIMNNVVAAGAARQTSPGDVVTEYARLLEAKDFTHAYNLWEPGARPASESAFEKQFDHLKTIRAAVGTLGPSEGAAGSVYSKAQLTLTGSKDDGEPYTLTGPVTLRRVNDVPGSTAEQRQWHIYKMDLTSNAGAAKKALNQ